MTIDPATLGAPVTDLDDYVAARHPSGCEAGDGEAPATDHDGSTRSTRARWAVFPILVAVIAGAFTLGRAGMSSAGVVSPVTPSPEGLEGFAELYVATYLAASGPDRSTVLAAFGLDLDAPGTPAANERYVTRTATIRFEPIGPDYWSVLVAADVLYRSEDGYAPGGIEYYEVAVAAVDGGMIGTGPPLPAAPPAASVPYDTYADLRTPADEATTAFLAEFAEAYFVAAERLPRLVTAAAVIPVPSRRAASIDVGAVYLGRIGDTAWATADVVLTDGAGRTLPTAITVRLEADPAGGARVAEVLPGPPPLPPSP